MILINIISQTGGVANRSSLQIYNGNTLYVGGNGAGNYSKIQDAIDNATDGETVFVFNDSSPYYERVTVRKSIRLIGENQRTTVIEYRNTYFPISITVSLTADDVTFSGFTVRTGGMFFGIDLARLMVVMGCVGMSRSCLESVIKYAKERKQFGNAIGSFQLIQGTIANSLQVFGG
jgi:alkylation response protein AidB-like acyl-CoA dehydrogenase